MEKEIQGLSVVGTVNNKSFYEGEHKTSYSVDLAVLGMGQMLRISIPGDKYHKINLGETFKTSLSYSVTKYGPKFAVV